MGKAKKDEKEAKADTKESALQRVIAQIEKQYGQGAIMQMDEHQYARIEGISTGSLSLDIALGGAGIPRGRVTELFGPESSRQNHTGAARYRQCPAKRRRGGVHRRRARTGYHLGQKAGRGCQQPAGQPAGHRRAGPRYRRDADQVQFGRCDRHRLVSRR